MVSTDQQFACLFKLEHCLLFSMAQFHSCRRENSLKYCCHYSHVHRFHYCVIAAHCPSGNCPTRNTIIINKIHSLSDSFRGHFSPIPFATVLVQMGARCFFLQMLSEHKGISIRLTPRPSFVIYLFCMALRLIGHWRTRWAHTPPFLFPPRQFKSIWGKCEN